MRRSIISLIQAIYLLAENRLFSFGVHISIRWSNGNRFEPKLIQFEERSGSLRVLTHHYLRLFDSHYLYSNTWNPPADLTSSFPHASKKHMDNLVGISGNKLWVATVMPGYNDTRIRPVGFVQERVGGAYYEQSWRAAIHSSPDWIVVTSFNEWTEGSQIEPSTIYGEHYLNLTSIWSQQFKSGAFRAGDISTTRDDASMASLSIIR